MIINKLLRFSLLSLLSFCIVFQSQGQSASDKPRFAVISDTHFENNVGQGANFKVPQALKNIIAKGNIDAIFVVGDITDGGTTAQYDHLNKVFTDKNIIPESVKVYFLMGNHDNFDSNGPNNYQRKLGNSTTPSYPLHQYIEIKGYPFITISQTGTGNADYNVVAQTFLKNSLADAAEKYPDKPIFVFTHVPPYNTCYGSRQVDGWGSTIFPPILEKYPQVVVFSGHSHYPLGDPRSIYQNKFTAINDGSTTYSEVEPGVVSEGIHPAGYTNVTEGVIVNVLENGNVDLERWDTYRNEAILPNWLLEAPFDGTKFAYKDRGGLPGPSFAEGVKPTVTYNKGRLSCTVSFPQATDNELIFRYRIEVLDDGNLLATYNRFSQFYLNSATPDPFEQTLSNLPPNKTISIRVKAFDSYNNESEWIESDLFTTDEQTSTPVAKFNPTLYYAFDNPNDYASPAIGASALSFYDKTGNSSLGVLGNPPTGSAEGPYSGKNAVTIPKDKHIKVLNTTGASNDGKKLNTYTLLYDIKFKTSGVWYSLLQTNTANSDDGDIFIRNSDRAVGVSATGYSSEALNTNQWYRLVVTMDGSNGNGDYNIYSNGDLILHYKGTNTARDGRFSIGDAFCIFTDEDGEENDIDCAGFAFWGNRALTPEEVVALGPANVVPTEQSSSDKPRFAVISDTHFDNGRGEGARQKLPKALKHILGKEPVDALFVVGDLTDNGRADQYDMFIKVFNDKENIPEGLPVYYMMGNHDHFTNGGATAEALFQSKLKQQLNQYIIIKGYPFITISQNGSSDGRGGVDFNTTAKNYLSEKMADAAKNYPGKPIFVFFHMPPRNTVINSALYGTDVFTPVLNQYPNAIVFSGHLHYPIGDPRSIHQDKFTSLNDGSHTYAEIEPNVLTSGTIPENADYITEGFIVNVLENENVEIERWDTYRNEEILPKWLLEAPFDGTKFAYKNRTGLPLPSFSDEAKPVVTVDDGSCWVVYPQAIDNEVVRNYVIRILDGQNVIASYSQFSQYYLNSQMPQSLRVNLNIPEGKTLIAQVYAVDSYGNQSTAISSEPFTLAPYTPNPDVELPTADLLDVKFGENGAAEDISPLHNTIDKGSAKPQTYLNTAYNKWAAKFTGSSNSYYKVDYKNNQTIKNAFQNAFSMEIMYSTNNLDNITPVSATQNGGIGIEQLAGGKIQFWIYLGSAYKVVTAPISVVRNRYYHIICTYSKADEKVVIYVNGEKVASEFADGDFGFPAEKNQWICIGGDVSDAGNAEYALNGEITITRLYDKAISRDEAFALYKNEIGGGTAIGNPEVSTGKVYSKGKKLYVEGFSEIAKLDIYNVLGQNILTYSAMNGNKSIDILSKGIYIVRIQEEGVSSVYKEIIN
jgi:Icc-related predicted phosphoesterase